MYRRRSSLLDLLNSFLKSVMHESGAEQIKLQKMHFSNLCKALYFFFKISIYSSKPKVDHTEFDQ